MLKLLILSFAFLLTYSTSAQKSEGETIHQFPEKSAEYKGGFEELYKFLSENMQYPEEAKSNGIGGKVYVQFVVGSDGTIKNVKVMKGIAPICDDEAVRVIKLMPAWIPAESNGKPVASLYLLPVHFKLPEPQTPDDVEESVDGVE